MKKAIAILAAILATAFGAWAGNTGRVAVEWQWKYTDQPALEGWRVYQSTDHEKWELVRPLLRVYPVLIDGGDVLTTRTVAVVVTGNAAMDDSLRTTSTVVSDVPMKVPVWYRVSAVSYLGTEGEISSDTVTIVHDNRKPAPPERVKITHQEP